MTTALALPFLAALACGVLAVAVGLRRERSPVASAVLGLLLALGLWNGGLGVADAVDPGPGRGASLRVAVLAMFGAVGFWLLVALRHRWPRRAQGAPAAVLALAPAAIFFVGAVTNASHGWFVVPAADWDPSRVGWAGPATWALALWTFVYGLAGTAIFLVAGLEMVRHDERRAGIALLLALIALPLLTMRPIDPEIVLPIAAAAMSATTLVLALTALRYQLLEPPPLGHREVIDHLRHGVLMANAAGEVLDRNPAAAGLLGFEPRGVSIAEAVVRVASPGTRERTRRSLARLGGTGGPMVLEIEDADGRTLEVSSWPIAGEDGESLGQVATLRDRSEERRFADAALRKQKLETLGTLAAGIAHEVNNPLAFVRAGVGEIARIGEAVEQALRAGAGIAPGMNRLGALARDAAVELERIQRAISDVRRLAAAPDTGDESLALADIVREAVGLAQRRSHAPLHVEIHLAPDLPRLQGSAQLLVQAVLCLVLDAQRAARTVAEPRIDVETGADESGLFVRVRDNGPEAPESVADPARGRALAGPPDASRVGLGLSVAAGIAQDHGGSLCSDAGGYLLRFAGAEARP